jgi:DNA-binding transcriptional MerR regulator
VGSSVRLENYSAIPLYHIKAVAQTTGISPSTIRAWERRYQICRPRRTESGYRLYSERDIVMIRWLKVQVAAGMAISQAVSWLDSLAEAANGLQHVTLPEVNHNHFEPIAISAGSPLRRLITGGE